MAGLPGGSAAILAGAAYCRLVGRMVELSSKTLYVVQPLRRAVHQRHCPQRQTP